MAQYEVEECGQKPTHTALFPWVCAAGGGGGEEAPERLWVFRPETTQQGARWVPEGAAARSKTESARSGKGVC